MKSFYDVKIEDIVKDLDDGIYPAVFIDRYQIVPSSNDQFKPVLEELNRVLDKILISNAKRINRKNFRPQILISAEKGANAFTYRDVQNTPFLVLTLDLIAQANSEDELAGVISHELHHILDPKSEHHHGQLSECACDIWAVEILREAGYSPSGYAEFFKHEAEEKRGNQQIGSAYEHLFSSHPSHSNRFLQVNNTELALNSMKGKTDLTGKAIALKPKSAVLIKLPNIKITTEFERILERRGMKNNSTCLESIAIILDCLRKHEFYSSQAMIGLYREDNFDCLLIAELEKHKGIALTSAQNEAYFDKLQLFRDWYITEKFKFRGTPLLRWLNDEILKNPLKEFDRIKEIKSTLLILRDTQSIADKAEMYLSVRRLSEKMIRNLSEHYHSKNAINYLTEQLKGEIVSFKPRCYDFQNPEQKEIDSLKEGETLLTPWDALVEMALKEFAENKTKHIANVLYVMNVTQDARIIKMQENLTYPIILLKKTIANRKKLAFDKNGKIVNTHSNLRQVQEDKLVQTMDWQELRPHPTGIGCDAFIKKYEPWLKLESEPFRTSNLQTNYIFLMEFLNNFIKFYSVEEDFFYKFLAQIAPHIKKSLPYQNPFIQFLLNFDWKINYNNRYSCDEFILTYINDMSLINNALRVNIPEISSIEEWEKYFLKGGFFAGLPAVILANAGAKLLATYADVIRVDQLLHFESMHAGLGYERSSALIAKVKIVQETKMIIALKPISSKKELFDEINIYMALNRFIKATISTKPYFMGKSKMQLELLRKIKKDYTATVLYNSEKIEVLEKLLFTQTRALPYQSIPYALSYQQVLLNEKYKVFFVDEYVKALTEVAKQFTVEPLQYENKVKEIIDNILQGADPAICKQILTKFADSIIAQRKLASYISQALNKKFEDKGAGQYDSLEAMYRLVNAVTASSTSKEVMLEFLLSPPTYDHCEKTFSKIKFYLAEGNNEKFNDDTYTYLSLIHQNFWEADPIARAALFQKLLYTKSYDQMEWTDAVVSTRAQDYVMDRIFADSVGKKNESDERKIVLSYLQACTEAEKTKIISMMLASTEPRENAEAHKTKGQTLKMILDNLGPAGTKLAQAINSHPATPEDIKRDTASSKSMAHKPTRWELFDLLDECYKDSKDLKYVGDILGAGAYGVTVEVEKIDQSKSAITLLRYNAFERAKTEFITLEKAAKLLTKKDLKFAPVIDMIHQANKASHEETDMQLADKQDKIAHGLYDQVIVKIGREDDIQTYTFVTSKWLGFGPRYKETAIVPGLHFADLPYVTNLDKNYKRNIAIAILTAELKNLFAGKYFDHDRHGAQQRISGNIIGQFDFGGVSIHLPTTEMKLKLGKMLGIVLRKGNVDDFVGALHSALQSIPKSCEEQEFFAKVERAILALNDYKPYVSTDDFLSLFASMRMHMDEDVSRGLGRELVNTPISLFNRYHSQTALQKLDLKLIAGITVPITLVTPQGKQNIANMALNVPAAAKPGVGK